MEPVDITEKPKKKTMTFVTPELHEYMLKNSLEEEELLTRLKQGTFYRHFEILPILYSGVIYNKDL
jgi:hypothetical protein